MRYKRNTVVLTLCLPVDRAKMVLNRLWACKCLTDEQYEKKMMKVDAREVESRAKRKDKLGELYKEVKNFYETEKK